ncbi:biotin--[acetyl-CoA-carboxylase] ligase [Edaphobacter acidisoli]|uniref:Biotin--[acetyl-CoA-carboxylase] ligase n=1 Tax=Edaphobacter acidisoli TaxID=2040573 RepID=A0A916RS50_9BACT|nr:biotin--[acetyl-CoA-carboxylase] ligase [Edaphobacter acidisoli]GGA66863.1 biotin--[acetyl-CoA-carboxylase] ligase [Edaphobacter acidisoli]
MFDLDKVEAGITGTEFAGRITHYPSVESTSTLALETAQAGAKAGVWVADEQTAGRGRGGHTWHSTAGDGLYVSALVTPPIPMNMAMWIPLATGLATQAAIHSVTGMSVDIRWPNDLLLNRKKCGGILVESASSANTAAESPMLRYAVIGVGINLNHVAFPPEIEPLATSLRKESGATVSRDDLLISLLRSLDKEISLLARQYQGIHNGPGLLERFTAASTWIKSKHVHVDEDGGYTGITDGLDSRGFLRIRSDDGTTRTVLSGGVREI